MGFHTSLPDGSEYLKTKKLNLIYTFNNLFSYLHFVPPLLLHFHLKFKQLNDISDTKILYRELSPRPGRGANIKVVEVIL